MVRSHRDALDADFAVLCLKRERDADLLGVTDYELGKLLDTLEGEDYTVMVFSDASEFKAYEPEFSAPVHLDMKRAIERQVVRGSKGNSTSDNRPLFEKYQFFTPGKST
jgi:hypothetical protein